MKKWIYILLILIISSVCYSLFYNAKTHVDTVKVVDELIVKSDSLTGTVEILHKEKDSALTQIELLDSMIEKKDAIIGQQNSDLNGLKKETANLKKMGPIVIHDTVYITETKNFWGKKKTSIENSTVIDTVDVTEPETQIDSIK